MMLTKSNVEKAGNPYGMGLFMHGEAGNQSGCLGHSGEQTGVSAQLMIIPSRETVVVVMTHTSAPWHEAIQLSVELLSLSTEVKVMGE